MNQGITRLHNTLLKLARITPPTPLVRRSTVSYDDNLNDTSVAVFHLASPSTIEPHIKDVLKGAATHRLSRSNSNTPPNAPFQALLLNVCELKHTDDLMALHAITHPLIGHLRPNGRIVILSNACDTQNNLSPLPQASIIPALEGFMRSLSKEVGRLGTTVNLIHIKKNAVGQMPDVLRFLLSERSAFISAQTFTITQKIKDAPPHTHPALLAGKRIIVTGAARGIGLAIATALTREGAQVIGIDMPNTPSLKAQMTQLNGLALELDITTDDATKQLCDFLHSHTGAVNGIIHNAGITRDKTLKYMSEAQWQSVLDVNFVAPIKLTQALLDQNMILKGGRIMGLSSISGIAGNAGQTNYALTKGGLAGYMQGLSQELAQRGITANSIAPGFIETEMTAQIPFMVRTIGRRFNALKQGGLPEDVAELVVFLASAHSAGITGHNIRVCGHNLLGK